MKSLRLIATASLLFGAMGASAQSMKPGLWEMTQKKMTSSSAEMNNAMAAMHAQMAKMSPEQRKQMQDMMAKQGVNMDFSGSGAKPGEMVVKLCMTQELIDQNQTAPAQAGCTYTKSPRVGSTWKMSFTCANPPSSGEGLTTIISPEAYTTKMTINTSATGKPERMDMEGEGKWLGASCGDIKPFVIPKK
jgi:hypothetical protein